MNIKRILSCNDSRREEPGAAAVVRPPRVGIAAAAVGVLPGRTGGGAALSFPLRLRQSDGGIELALDSSK